MKSVSLAEFLRPVEGIDEHAQRVLAQPCGGAWGLDGDGEDRGPARGLGKRAVRIAPLGPGDPKTVIGGADRSEEHTSELQSLMRTSYAVFCLKKKTNNKI